MAMFDFTSIQKVNYVCNFFSQCLNSDVTNFLQWCLYGILQSLCLWLVKYRTSAIFEIGICIDFWLLLWKCREQSMMDVWYKRRRLWPSSSSSSSSFFKESQLSLNGYDIADEYLSVRKAELPKRCTVVPLDLPLTFSLRYWSWVRVLWLRSKCEFAFEKV